MWIPFDSPAVRLTGRWGVQDGAAVTTAAGAYFEAAFTGSLAVLRFDMRFMTEPLPHVWISVDGGARVEAPLCAYLRVAAPDAGEHVVTVIFKGMMEEQHRWHYPQVAKLAFIGMDADGAGTLPADDRRIIEFVGDSITEGVLVDEECRISSDMDQFNRPVQDDSTATYAWLTAQALGLRPIIMGYGWVGVTHRGCGSVPAAGVAYPFCFDCAPVTGPSPDYVVINHGTNDRGFPLEEFHAGYRLLLDQIVTAHPRAKVFAMIPFCGAFAQELPALVEEYNREHGTAVTVIDTAGWVPPEPLHPTRDGHAAAAARLTEILRKAIAD